jgi:hypothetical protein
MPKRTIIQWPYGSFVHIADEFLISYACSPWTPAASLFLVGHAAELYLKAVLVKSKPTVDAASHGHKIEKLLDTVQSLHPGLLREYTLRKSAAHRWMHSWQIAPSAPDSDYDHFRQHMELYWVSRYLADTKYFGASYLQIDKGFALILQPLNPYWQQFFFEIRRHLGVPNPETQPDKIAQAIADTGFPPYAKVYLSRLV